MNNQYYYGFNFLWMFHKKWSSGKIDEKALDFMQDLGLNFARIPVDYRFWTRDTDYLHPHMPTIEHLYEIFKACDKRNIHFCLNLHRAPGYCINENELEKDNLWIDAKARDAFVFLWEIFAKQFKGIEKERVSFNLINEPPGIGQYGFTRENHKAIMTRAAQAIWAIDPDRPVIIDGLAGGNLAMPEMCDLPFIHSTRGYEPRALTHFKAAWCKDIRDIKKTEYPGTRWDGKEWNKSVLKEFYLPWLDLQQKGIQIQVGEFGCYNKVPNQYAIKWFKDLFSLFKEWKWSYALWNFEGPFGLINHGRPGTQYKKYNGFKVDKELLELFLSHRILKT